MITRRFALVVGIIYLVIGIAGFVPGLVQAQVYPDLLVETGSGALLGLFPVNVLHHLVHLLVGILGVAAYRTFASARLYARGLAIVYGLLAVLGLIPAANLDTLFGLVPLFSHDVWLHAGTALIAAYVGWGVAESREETLRRA